VTAIHYSVFAALGHARVMLLCCADRVRCDELASSAGPKIKNRL